MPVEQFTIEVRIDPKSGLDRDEVKKKVIEAARNLAVSGCAAAVFNTYPPGGDGELFFERFPY